MMEQKRDFNIKKIILCVTIIAALCAMALTACGKADISAYQDEQILVTGLGDDFYVTPLELSEMECKYATAQGKTEKAGTVKGYGPTLKSFVEEHGHELSEFKSIRFTAKDDYTINLGRVTWEKHDVIMSIAHGSEALYEGEQPLRLVIPGADSGNWIYSVVKIEFNSK